MLIGYILPAKYFVEAIKYHEKTIGKSVFDFCFNNVLCANA
jgi:hypothetical protein